MTAKNRVANDGKGAQGMESDVGDDPRATGFHTDAIRCGSVHLRSALRVLENGCFSNSSFPDAEGIFADSGQ